MSMLTLHHEPRLREPDMRETKGFPEGVVIAMLASLPPCPKETSNWSPPPCPKDTSDGSAVHHETLPPMGWQAATAMRESGVAVRLAITPTVVGRPARGRCRGSRARAATAASA